MAKASAEFELGQAACEAGTSVTRCPYDAQAEPIAWREWVMGWIAARTLIEAQAVGA